MNKPRVDQPPEAQGGLGAYPYQPRDGGLVPNLARKQQRVGRVAGDYLRRQRQHQVVREGRKKPLIIELAGTPNASKDTLVSIISDYLQDVHSYRVRVFDEAIRSCHIDKSLYVERVYQTVALTVVRLYEASLENPGDYDFIIFNRGLFDRLAFIHMAQMSGHISQEQERIHVDYLLSYAHLQDIVFLFLISPEESLRRERESRRNFVANLAKRDGKPLAGQRIHNREMLNLLNSSYIQAYHNYKSLFKHVDLLDLIDGDYVSTVEKALRLSEVILPERPTQLAIPELFDPCSAGGDPTDKADHRSQRFLPASRGQSRKKQEFPVQLSLFGRKAL